MSVVIEHGFVGDLYPLDHPRVGYASFPGTVAASSAAPGFGASLAIGRDTVDAWKPATVPATWDVTYSSAQRVTYIGIGAHTIGSSGATVKAQRRIGGAWVDVPGCEVTPEDDSAVLFLVAPVQCLGVRLVLSGAVAELGVIMAGPVLEWPRRALYTGLPISEGSVIEYEEGRSRTGEYMGRTIRSDGLEFELQVEHLSEQFRQTEWRDFRAHLDRGEGTFFIADRPGRYLDDVAYAWPAERSVFERTIPNHRVAGSVTIPCRGYNRA